MENKLKGIEPIIAVVILVAVTLVIAIAVVGWIMGWWSAVGKPPESLKITPVSLKKVDNAWNVTLYICNDGSANATVSGVTITGVGGANTISGNTTIPPGECGTIQASISGGINPGVVYEVQVTTKAGNVYKTVIRAE
ncbi:MAG: archaellin/type IV pilin N-terminal domain-containing protein [Desulfurococcaceae archaeon]